MELQVLGPLRLRRHGEEVDAGPRQQRCLLALLLARVGNPVGTTDLLELLWGADPPASAVNVVHKYVGALRRLLEPGLVPRSQGSYLTRHGNGYRFTAGPETLDLVAFRRLVADAKASAGSDDPGRALDLYLEALGLGRGRTGDGLADTPCARAVFARLDGEFCDAAVAAAEIALQLREPARMLAPLRRAAEMEPLDEPVHASLMTMLAAAGHQAEALSIHRAIRARLGDELGIEPGRELQEAQRRVLTQTVLPPAVEPGVRPAQLPPGLTVFAGRAGELATLHRLATRCGPGPAVIALDGMGGVGKSALAVRFAHEVAADFPDGQLHLDLRGVPAGEALRALLHGLGTRAPDVPLVGVYRSLTAGKRLLVLLDNAQDAAQVRPLLPASAGSLVLVTSRRPLLGLAAGDGAQLMRVDVPDLRTARELLGRRLARAADADLCDEIIELCGRLPSALAIVAARLAARPGLSLAAIADDLRDDARRLDVFAGHGVDDPRTAIAGAYRQLSAGAAGLFRRLSTTGGPATDGSALSELVDAALVTEHDDGRVSMHVLVRAYGAQLHRALRRGAATA
ncbi:BTAD domain-containing putative transcriptional regulator [Catenuloplanes sp. NPDC051500]|uniref:AfsR/SARP family transcriptional regulator n=1 Tax=Catenuloplanes sp. NPDC051500 TaxID=3363959 RepID=UPI00379AAF19